MKRKELQQLLEKYIDSDFTVGVGLGSAIQDTSGYHINSGIQPQQRGIDKFHDGFLFGHKMNIDPKIKIHDMRIIKEDGSEIDLKKDGIEFGDII